MKHKILSSKAANPYVFLDVQLLPDNEIEQTAINNVRNMVSSQEEKDLVENYLIFTLSAVSMDWKDNNRVLLKSSTV